MRFPDYFFDVCDRLQIDPVAHVPIPPGAAWQDDGAWWVLDPWAIEPADGVEFFLEPLDEGPAPDDGYDFPLGGYAGGAPATPDHLALYRPWHFAGPDWGIYLNGPELPAYVNMIAAMAGHPPRHAAPFVLRTLIDHELAHFAVEVGATMMEDVVGVSLYREYLTQRFHQVNEFNVMPLEEAFATWREVHTRRLPGLGPAPPGLLDAIRYAVAGMGPGYSEWRHWARRPITARRELAQAIRGDDVSGGDWFGPALLHGRPQDIPMYWVGDPHLIPHFGGLPRTVGQIQVRRLRTWLQGTLGATYYPGRGKGSHEWWETPDQRVVSFMHTRDGLLSHKDRRRITKVLSMTPQEFYDAVMG